MTATPTSDLSTFLGTDPGVERLYDNVQSEVPGVTLAQIKMAAWNTIEDFYIRSTWRREHLFWEMPAGVYAVDFNPFDADWLVAWVLAWNGLTNGKVEPPALLRDIGFPLATTTRNGEVWLALKPTDFSADFDPLLWQQWFETILAGTLHRLYRQPAKPYSSPQLALLHGRTFNLGVARARGIAHNNYAGNTPSWRFPRFAGGRAK
jgi:hypothetical protein